MQTDFSDSLYVNNFGLFPRYLQYYVNKLGALFKFKEYVDIFIFQSCWPGYDLRTHFNLCGLWLLWQSSFQSFCSTFQICLTFALHSGQSESWVVVYLYILNFLVYN